MTRIIQIRNNKETADSWCGQELQSGETYIIPAGTVLDERFMPNIKVNTDILTGDLSVGNGTIFFANPYAGLKWLQDTEPNPKTTDDRDVIAANRIPLGYTIYPTGTSDDIVNGAYGDGYGIKMDDTDTANGSNKVTVQFMEHWFGIGGRVIWESASLADSISAMLVAPATTGLTNVTGDYTKVNLGGPYNVIIPVPPGTGNWSMNLAATLNAHVHILKCTPVPSAGNTGWFDYNSDTNTLTRNTAQTGGYNLYDFDINLFRFARKIWGRKADGSETDLESTDVVGKLLYNTWQVRFKLDNVTSGVKCGVIIKAAMKKNI